MSCWACHEPVAGRVCVGCGALQPPPPQPDPFAMFDLPARWHLDPAELDARWKALARQVHPDRFAGRSAAERRLALAWTAAMNEARRLLRDPTRRAWWLATGAPEAPQTGARLEPAFLADVFAWREADEDSPGAFARLSAERRAALDAELDAAFTAWEEGRGTLDAVPSLLHRLQTLKGHAPGGS